MMVFHIKVCPRISFFSSFEAKPSVLEYKWLDFFAAIGGVSGDLLEQNAQMFNQVSSNFSAFQVNSTSTFHHVEFFWYTWQDLFICLVLVCFWSILKFALVIVYLSETLSSRCRYMRTSISCVKLGTISSQSWTSNTFSQIFSWSYFLLTQNIFSCFADWTVVLQLEWHARGYEADASSSGEGERRAGEFDPPSPASSNEVVILLYRAGPWLVSDQQLSLILGINEESNKSIAG